MLYISYMIRTQIYLTQELKKELDRLKKIEGKPVGEIIRKILHKAIIADKKKQKGNDLTKLAELNIHGGPKDLSEHMDEYLYGDR
jgi:metal-responsive CopG/Arc/MetJ family transcriptional regulator